MPEGQLVPISQPLPDDPIDLAHSSWRDQGWGESADGMAVVTSIMRVQQVLLARVEAILRPLGLTFARYEVLMLLRFSRKGFLPVGKIGERLQVHPASVTNAVQLINDFNTAKQKYTATAAAFDQNKLSYELYYEKYKLGQISSVELLTAQDILNMATSKYLQAWLQLFFQYKMLELLQKN